MHRLTISAGGEGQQLPGIAIERGTGAGQVAGRGRDPLCGKPHALKGGPAVAQTHASKAPVGIHVVFKPGLAALDEERAKSCPRRAQQRPGEA